MRHLLYKSLHDQFAYIHFDRLLLEHVYKRKELVLKETTERKFTILAKIVRAKKESTTTKKDNLTGQLRIQKHLRVKILLHQYIADIFICCQSEFLDEIGDK